MQYNLSSRRRRTTVGVCAMAKKSGSRPMEEILRRLPVSKFEIVIFEEKAILEEEVEKWPIVDCLIAFHSHGFPLDKAVAYESLRRPFVLNDLRRQYVLRDRRRVYEALAKAGVPTPRHAAFSRDWEEQGLAPKQTLEEFDDQITVNGVTILKPFVEKPVDADDHNIYIYYPMSAGGGSKRLFRKVDNKSSRYYSDEHKVRTEGSYIYEEFVDTQGTDVKVYSVGPYYGHAEARKSPTLDGIVMRGDDGKELRYPVILSWVEKDIAFKIYHAFKQTVCGFDILRTHDGKHIVCDVNGWSFVKKSRKYYDDCASLLAELMEHRRPPNLPVAAAAVVPRLPATIRKSSPPATPTTATVRSMEKANSETIRLSSSAPQNQRLAAESPIRKRMFSDIPVSTTNTPRSEGIAADSTPPNARTHETNEPFFGPQKKPERELRCVIAVVRHGDRTPKRKLKVKVRHPKLVAVHTAELASRKKNEAANSARGVELALAMPGAGPISLCDNTASTVASVAAVNAAPTKQQSKRLSKMEVKIRESKDLRTFAGLVRSVLDEDERPKRSGSYGGKEELPIASNTHQIDSKSKEYFANAVRRSRSERELKPEKRWQDTQAEHDERLALAQLRDVLEQHIPVNPLNNATSLNTALFSGCKLQLKPCEWIRDDSAPDGRRTTAIMLVLKWGGVLTELGVEHAYALGAHFRRSMYPASEDGAGLLRLHATFRHDLKIRTSDEGRVMKTGAAFTKGLLELEGDISPILVSLIHRGRTDVNMLDRAGNHEAQDLLAAAKTHVEQAFQVDVNLDGKNESGLGAKARRCIAPDGPESVLVALRDLKNPRRALEDLYTLVDGLVKALEAYCLSSNADAEQKLYMGETLRVWLDSWRDVRSELRTKKEDEWLYDLSKIPEIFDKVRFDAQHNAKTMGLYHTYPDFKALVNQAQLLSKAVAPLEFGGTADRRRDIAWLVSRALLDKIRQDLQTARGASGDANAGLHFQLDDDPQHLADAQIKSSWRAVRSRLYFTSESHLHALLTALRIPADIPADQLNKAPHDDFIISEQARNWLSHIPELSYLSHIVFRLWEDPAYEENNPRRYMVELSFSPGTPFSVDDDNDEILTAPDHKRTNDHHNIDILDSSDANSDSTLAGHESNHETPTYPLEPFAYVPCQRLENYISASPHFTSSNTCLADATSTYNALAQELLAIAKEQQKIALHQENLKVQSMSSKVDNGGRSHSA